MTDVFPEAGFIDERHLRAPSACDVAGLLKLDGVAGTASAFSLADQDGKVRSFTFKRKGSRMPRLWDNKQAVADIVLVEIPLKGEQATLKLRKFGSQEPPSDIVLKAAEGDTYIDIVLGNLPPFNGTHASSATQNPTNRVDHFELYYKLASHQLGGVVEIPHLGRRKFRTHVEAPSPRIVQFVERRPGLGGADAGAVAAAHRPICASVIFE
jgi:hypothetical protein